MLDDDLSADLRGWAAAEAGYLRTAIETLRPDGPVCAVGMIYVDGGPLLVTLAGVLSRAQRDRWLSELGVEKALDWIWSPAEYPLQVDVDALTVHEYKRTRANGRMRRRLRATGQRYPEGGMWDTVARELTEQPPRVECTDDFLAFVVEHDSDDVFGRLQGYVPEATIDQWRARDLFRWSRFDGI